VTGYVRNTTFHRFCASLLRNFLTHTIPPHPAFCTLPAAAQPSHRCAATPQLPILHHAVFLPLRRRWQYIRATSRWQRISPACAAHHTLRFPTHHTTATAFRFNTALPCPTIRTFDARYYFLAFRLPTPCYAATYLDSSTCLFLRQHNSTQHSGSPGHAALAPSHILTWTNMVTDIPRSPAAPAYTTHPRTHFLRFCAATATRRS